MDRKEELEVLLNIMCEYAYNKGRASMRGDLNLVSKIDDIVNSQIKVDIMRLLDK